MLGASACRCSGPYTLANRLCLTRQLTPWRAPSHPQGSVPTTPLLKSPLPDSFNQLRSPLGSRHHSHTTTCLLGQGTHLLLARHRASPCDPSSQHSIEHAKHLRNASCSQILSSVQTSLPSSPASRLSSSCPWTHSSPAEPSFSTLREAEGSSLGRSWASSRLSIHSWHQRPNC